MPRYRLVSWNVNGIRAVSKKGFWEWLSKDDADIVGLQETKISSDQLTLEHVSPMGYQTFWSHAEEKRGYSGVAVLTKTKPISVREGLGVPAYDAEGRTLVAEYPEFTLFNIYYPNGQRGEDRLQYKLGFYDAFLEAADALRQSGKPLVICGDFNTAHHPIDLARPKENEKVSGFLPIERAWMDKFVAAGYVDTFRHMHPGEADRYSWWNMRSRARERNVGWRIDYFFTTSDLLPHIRLADIHPAVEGSDHCPVSLELEF
jgi:exodeoxyribonuclease III